MGVDDMVKWAETYIKHSEQRPLLVLSGITSLLPWAEPGMNPHLESVSPDVE